MHPAMPQHEAEKTCGRLRVAREQMEAAREHWKEQRRHQLSERGEGNHRRLVKGDSSLNEMEKYRRRLRKNQDSAAAARYARAVYISALEKCVTSAEAQQSMLSLEAAGLRADRDALAAHVLEMQEELAGLLQQQDDCDGNNANGVDTNASTELLLKRTAQSGDLPGTVTSFAESLMGVKAAPAV